MKNTGNFKPKKKFLGFISAFKSGHRVNADNATISGKYFSGMLEDKTFDMTIYKDGTVDLVDLDNSVDEGTLSRIVEQICEMEVTGYTGKFIVHGLEFKSKDTMDGLIKVTKKSNFYLEIEHKKPIDLLFSIIENEDNKARLSTKAMSMLDSLLGDDSNESKCDTVPDEVEVEVMEVPETSKEISYLEASFIKMKEDKVIELKDRIENMKSEIKKSEFEKKSVENKLSKCKEDLGILNTRLDSMTPASDPNGWFFFVSEEKKSGVDNDDKTKEIVGKISPLLNLIPDRILNYLIEGHFVIKIGNKDTMDKDKSTDDGPDIESQADVLEKILGIDPLGKIKIVDKFEYEYRGDLNWHQIVSKMIKMGFEQNPEFDKLSGSNSYNMDKSEDEMSESDITSNGIKVKIEKFENFNTILDSLEKEYNSKGEDEYDDEDTDPKDLIFALYGITHEGGEKKTAIYVTPREYFEENGHMSDEHLSDDLIPGMDQIQEGIYILGELGNESHDYKDLIKRALDAGLSPDVPFQNYVSGKAKTDNTWEFFDLWSLQDILDELKQPIKGPKIYFSVDIDNDEQIKWDDDRLVYVMFSLDKDEWDASEPRWEMISPAFKRMGLVPEYDGYSMESTVTFERDDQSDNIKNMTWTQVRRYIIDGLFKEGWELV